jgi:hypothetical protein
MYSRNEAYKLICHIFTIFNAKNILLFRKFSNLAPYVFGYHFLML